jgi:DNA-binding transcriptional LysR family regulator
VSVELRHLRYFVAVAEELNFTRAAERLHIAQQALSSAIRQLEERVGAQLVERTTRKVELTPAGVALLESARALLAGADEAVAAAREAAGERPSLTLGVIAAVTHDKMGHALELFGERHPEANVLVRFGDPLDPTGGLRTNEADVASVYGPFDTTGLELAHLWDDPMIAAMTPDHPLAAKDEVTVEELVEEPTFDFPTRDQKWRDYWMLTAYRNGRPPRIVAEFRTLDALIEAIRAGLGVHVASTSLTDMIKPGSGIVWRPIREFPPLRHSIAWRAGDERELVREFVDACREAFGQPPLER